MPFPSYDIATETNDGQADTTRLHYQVLLSALVATDFRGWTTTNGTVNAVFDTTPSGGDQTIVDAVVAAHNGVLAPNDTGIRKVQLTHDSDHPINETPLAPSWSGVDNRDINAQLIIYPHNGNEARSVASQPALWRIKYRATIKTTDTYVVVRASVEDDNGAIDGLDSEVALRSGGSDFGQLSGEQDVVLPPFSSVSPYFYTEVGAATGVGNQMAWSLEYLTARNVT